MNSSNTDIHSFSIEYNQSSPLLLPPLSSTSLLSTLATKSSSTHAPSPSTPNTVDYDSLSLELDRLPIEQLLQSEWFHQNISQTLNISMENVTNLLHNAHQYIVKNGNDSNVGGGINHSSGNPIARDSFWLLLTLTIFYSLIFVTGVLGNLITCIVISGDKDMHTATNFYLFNLAISDLILLVSGMPQELYNTWYPEKYPFNNLLCKMEGIFSETAANATVLTITAFTVERYIAISHPFRQKTLTKLSRAVKFILAIWVTAFLLALPQAMQFSVVPQNKGLECTMENDFFAHVFAVSGFIFFGGPMTAICVLYVLIGLKLKPSRLLRTLPRRRDENGGNAQSRVIRMLVAVAVAFFLCWAPFHAQRLMAAYGSSAESTSDLFNEVYHALNYISGVLYFLSTCINPLLYNVMSKKFRDAFKLTLAQKCGLGDPNVHKKHHRYSAMMRQNGSMRMNTTVNSNAFETVDSFRVLKLQCRDTNNHLSSQDSIRTTITTATLNSANGMNGSNNIRRCSSQRSRCVSMSGSGKPLPSKSLSKPDNCVKSTVPPPPSRNYAERRILQTQFSQLSSVGDATSVIEADDVSSECYSHSQPNSYHMTQLQHHSLIANARRDGTYERGIAVSGANAEIRNGKTGTDFAEAGRTTMADQNERYQNNNGMIRQYSRNEIASSSTKPFIASQITEDTLVTTQPLQSLNSVAELPIANAPTNKRLKLSRILSRRQRDVLLAQNPRVELIHRHLPGMGHHQNQYQLPHLLQPVYEKRTSNKAHYDVFNSLRKRLRRRQQKRRSSSTSTLDYLTQRFRWRAKESGISLRANENGADDLHVRQNLTPTDTVLMRIVYPTTAVSTAAVVTSDDCLQIRKENELKNTTSKVF